jgi:hypothetical protein
MRRTTATLLALCVVVVPVRPAAAEPPAAVPPIVIDGYVWASQPASPSYVAATGYEYNSAGGTVQVTRTAVGTYQVRFQWMAGTGGVAHAGAYGSNRICTVASWGPWLGDEVVNVRCFDLTGAPADTRFVASVSNRQEPDMGYLWSDDPTPPAAGHTPAAPWSYDSTGDPIEVYRSAAGAYQVALGAFAQDSPDLWASGHLRVTAYGTSARYCQVLDPALLDDPALIDVRCFDDTGHGADTRFALSYDRQTMNASATVDIIGAPAVQGWTNSAGGAPSVTELGVGDVRISFPDAGVPRGHAIGAVMGTPPMFCNVHAWWQAGGDEHVRVRCYDPGDGDPTPAVKLNLGFRA